MNDHLAALRAEGQALAAAARRGLDAPVPSCPGWDVAGLLRHTGHGYRWVTHILRTAARAEVTDAEVPPAVLDDPLAEYERALDDLVTALAARPAGQEVWTWWAPERHVGFWARRMAHETAVHRWDVQLAHDVTAPIDPARAVDGIDESLTVFVGEYLRDEPQEGLGGSFRVTATDTGDTWHGTLRPDGVDITRDETAAADAKFTGTAHDLMLGFWGRGTPMAASGDERIVGLLTG